MRSYPNPFNPSTTLEFDNPHRSLVSVRIFDVLGRRIETLVEKELLEAGTYVRQWNASGIAGGVYFARIEGGSGTATIKLILLK